MWGAEKTPYGRFCKGKWLSGAMWGSLPTMLALNKGRQGIHRLGTQPLGERSEQRFSWLGNDLSKGWNAPVSECVWSLPVLTVQSLNLGCDPAVDALSRQL